MARRTLRPLVPEVLERLRALSSEMDRLDDVAAPLYGLKRTDLRTLEILGRDGPSQPTELARALGFTTGGVTAVLDRLEHAGYVRRRPDPTDRRRLVIEVTDKTTQRDTEVFGNLVRRTRSLVETYPDAELAVIGGFLEQVSKITEQHATEVNRTTTK
jgi:DNA-binding MarR family transcriptional regulator